jgi:DNA-binding ferritin-like protein|tara:strand:- start:412 stop:774 length:363 start_codon:yes stop_codon:yes gene_type:complete
MKAADFVGLLFLARDVTHSVHLNTRSYAKHKALQKFYEGIVGLADTFAEAYQGRHGLMGGITLQTAKKTANVTEFLSDQLDEIESVRNKVVDKDDTALHNIIDEIVALYLSTLYKLKFLA